jgi:protein O-mannosyl-transferase
MLPARRYHGKYNDMVPLFLTARSGKSSFALGCLLLLAFLAYANTLVNGFVYDDHEQVELNPYVHSVHYVGRVLSTTVWSFQGAEGQTNYYRPLMTLSYLLCNKLFQSLPYGFHLANILLNCVVVWLVFWVSFMLWGDETVALCAAALFALHPIHTEVVAWIAAITELELAVFYLAAFVLFLRLGCGDPRREMMIRLFMAFSFVLALLSKEQAITLLPLLVIYEHLYRADRTTTNWKTKVSRYGGLVLTGCLYFVFRVTVLGGLAPVLKHPEVSPSQIPLCALALLGHYVGKLFWPHPLLAFYVFHKSTSFFELRVLLGFAALIAAVGLFIVLRRHARAYSFALIWMGVTLAPVLNPRWMATNVFAERYLYLPSIGFSALLAAGAVWVFRVAAGKPLVLRWAMAAAGVAVCGLAATQIVARNRDWHDDWTFLNRTLATEPHAALLRTDLGSLEWSRLNREEAKRQWLLALADKPDDAVALSNLGLAMLEERRYSDAEHYLRKAIELRPRFAAPHTHLAQVYLAEGGSAQAEAEFRTAVEVYPLSTQARNALGKFYFDQGKLAEAEQQYQASIESQPTEEALNALGEVYSRQGVFAKAEPMWRQALLLSPYDAEAHLGLARLYLTGGRRTEAKKEYEDVLLMDPGNLEARAALQKLGATNLPLAPRQPPHPNQVPTSDSFR